MSKTDLDLENEIGSRTLNLEVLDMRLTPLSFDDFIKEPVVDGVTVL